MDDFFLWFIFYLFLEIYLWGDFGHLYIFFLAGIYDSFASFCLISFGFESFILVFIGASMFCSFIHAVFFFFPKICFLTAKFFVECFSAVLDLAFCDGSQRLVDRFFSDWL